ncbi:unnamed protein product [Dicrocoelium dendriticum]|nr:unnamed protein product [Dicrocoelium dendriticum]
MSVRRTIESMREVLHCAKLDHHCSSGPIQAVTFASNLSSDEYRLFEVSEALAAHLTQPDSRIVMELKEEPKKNNAGRTFACTATETFTITEAETSNSLLLVSDWWLPNQESRSDKENECALYPTVNAMKSTYYELHGCIAPSLRLLKQVLYTSLYSGPFEEAIDSDDDTAAVVPVHPTRDDLAAKFPCSRSELARALLRLRAYEFGGAVRLMDSDYLCQVVRDVFSCADENGWSWRTIGLPYCAVIDSLSQSHDHSVLRQVLSQFFARRLCGRYASAADECFVFPRNSVICQLIGEQLLSVTTSFDMKDFLAVWKATVPEGLRPKLRKHLTCAGRAFSHLPSVPTSSINAGGGTTSLPFRSLSLLRSEDLPDESVESRISALFAQSKYWPEFELASYLTDILVSPVEPKESAKQHFSSGPSVPYASSDSESDFEYIDVVDLDKEFDCVDIPKPFPSCIGAALTRLCRVTTTHSGRFYSEKHPKT